MKIKEIQKNPWVLLRPVLHRGWLDRLPDKPYLKLKYRAYIGKKLRLEQPQTFNEKLQWLKLYDRKSEYVPLVDKYAVRAHVAQRVGEKVLVPLVGGPWSSFDEIDFDDLPEQFVLKCTHDSGGLVICTQKAALDKAAARKKIEACLKRNYFSRSREWPYKHVQPRIIAEKYMVDESGTELKDYKVMCFGGEAKLVQVHRGRFGAHTQDFFDAQWQRHRIYQGFPISEESTEKPVFLEEMLRLSERLSQGYPQLRVDWYYVDGQLYFGELTFFDGSGFDGFEPEEYDALLGSWITLPEKTIQE